MIRNSLPMLICIVLILGSGNIARANDSVLDDLEGNSQYDGSPMEGHVDLMSRKLMRGVTNLLTGLAEIPRQLKLATQEDRSAANFTQGGVTGIGMGLTRTLVGAVEIATFIMPAPGYYGPLLDPPVVWKQRQQSVKAAK